VQDAAYNSLVRNRRVALQAKIVGELISRRASGEEVSPEVLGHHCAEAEMFEDAAHHFLRAGEQSAARAALAEALELFEKALEQIDRLPESELRDQKEIEGLCARGAVFITLKGLAAPEIDQAYSQAGKLWVRLGRPPEYLRVPWGRWMYHVNRAEHCKAQVHGEDVLRIGREHSDSGALVLGSFCVGVNHLLQGELVAARTALQEAIQPVESASHKKLILQLGFDPFSSAFFFLGLNACWLGYPIQAISYASDSIGQAQQFDHPPTMGQAVAGSCRVASMLRDKEKLETWVQELRLLSQEHDYPHWWSQVFVFEGQLEMMRGNTDAAIMLLQQGYEAYRATGARLWDTYHAILLSEALERSGKFNEAWQLVDGNASTAGMSPELYRRRGQLLVDHDGLAAKSAFQQGIQIAQSQSAKFWELRATIDLCTLMSSKGENKAASELLLRIYEWFTEGFDTADLTAAKAMLAQFASKTK
jgi:tetratricopeptide (TPR) repeat protein